jgi:hypothetical protein
VSALGARPGKPRNVTARSWFVAHADGRVSFVVRRRAESGSPSGLELAFEGADDAEALAAYDEWTDAQAERVTRQAERRGKWGPRGAGRMS